MGWAEGGMGTGWVGWRQLCSHLGWLVGVTVMNKHSPEPKVILHPDLGSPA